ncbi:peroxidase 72-like protein [Tanacetum coccineum]
MLSSSSSLRKKMGKSIGRLSWDVLLGRRGSLGASLSGLKQNIPASNNTFQTILTKFKLEGLDIVAFLALSDTFRGKDEGEYHPLIEPSPLYGRGRDGLGGWFSSLIGGSHLTDVVISGIFFTAYKHDKYWNRPTVVAVVLSINLL